MKAPKNFNADRRIRLLVAAVILPLIAVPNLASADLILINAEMTNIRWTPAAGSIVWSSNWELEASAASFDSVSGHDHGDQFATCSPSTAATAQASSLTAHSTAWAKVGVDASGNLIQLRSSAQTTPASGLYVSAFSCASAYRKFTLTGGAGSVDVSFAFDYSARLSGTVDNPSQASLLDWLGILRISDGTSTWDVTAANQVTAPTDMTFSGTAQNTFRLQYGIPYSISLAKDNEITPSPEPSMILAVVFLVPAILLRCAWMRRTRLAALASRHAALALPGLFLTTRPSPRSSSGGLPMRCQSTPCRGRHLARIAGFLRRHGGVLSLLAGALTLVPSLSFAIIIPPPPPPCCPDCRDDDCSVSCGSVLNVVRGSMEDQYEVVALRSAGLTQSW